MTRRIILFGALSLSIGLRLLFFCWAPLPPFHEQANTAPGAVHGIAAQVQDPSLSPAHGPSPSKPQQIASTGLVLNQRPSDAPAWAIPYGQEFWKLPNPAGLSANMKTPLKLTNGVNVFHAVERVSHAFTLDKDGCSVKVSGHGYEASIGQGGLAMAAIEPSKALSASGKTDKAMSAVFHTTRIRRGEWGTSDESLTRSPMWSVMGDTAQAALDASAQVVQHVQAGPRGVEVTWVIAQVPDGRGPLEIEMETGVVATSTATASGLHITDAAGTSRLCVGPAKAVDSMHRVWNVTAIPTENGLRFSIPETVLAQATYPLAIDPLISPEEGVDNPVIGPSVCTQSAPVVASRGGVFLLVWTHGQSELLPPTVLGARLNSEGVSLDPFGFVIGLTAGENTTTAITANETGFMVVWSGPKGGSATDWDIFGAMVGFDGSVMGIPDLCKDSGMQCSPAIAAGQTNFFISWYDSRNTGVYGTLVTTNGVAVNPGGVALTTAANYQYTPSVAALNGQYLVVWQDFRHSTAKLPQAAIYGTRISEQGKALEARGIAIYMRTNTTQWSPVATISGTNYLVVWEDYNVKGNDLHMARVSMDGAVLDTNPMPVCQAANTQCNPSISSDGSNTLVVWQDYRNSLAMHADIYAARITLDATVVDPGGLLISRAEEGQWSPASAMVGENFQIVWQDFRFNVDSMSCDILGKLLAGFNETSPPRLLSQTANQEIAPAICAGSSNYWVAWSDNRNMSKSGMDIVGMRLDAKGQPLDLQVIPICTAPGNQSSPALAANDDGCMVVWTDYRNASNNVTQGDVYGAWLDNSGSVKQECAVAVAAGDQAAPAISAMTAENTAGAADKPFLVVWQDSRRSPTNSVQYDIFGARVSAPGIVREKDGFPICTLSQSQTAPAVAASMDKWLVVWADKRNGVTLDIFGARVDESGAVLDPDGFVISSASANQSAPSIAGNQDGFFVAWADQRFTYGPDILGARLDVNGRVLDPDGIALRVARQFQSAPAVASDGKAFTIVWQDALNRSTNDYNLFGTSVDSMGNVSAAWPVNTNALDQVAPSIAFLGGQFVLVAQGVIQLNTRTIQQTLILEPRFSEPVRRADGSCMFSLKVSPGQRVVIETSNDLEKWTADMTLTNSQDGNQTLVFQTTNSNQRFFRVKSTP